MGHALLHSLRLKLALWAAVPVLMAGFIVSTGSYYAERAKALHRLETTAHQIGGVVLNSLRYAMLAGDQDAIHQALADIGRHENIAQILILSSEGQIRFATENRWLGQQRSLADAGGVECHATAAPSDRQTVLTSLPNFEKVLRNCLPIDNEAACQECHASEDPLLGVLITDMLLSGVEHEAGAQLRESLLWTGISTLVGALAVYLPVHWLVVERVERFRAPLRKFARGDFSARVSELKGADELSELARTTNRMAAALERKTEDEWRTWQQQQQLAVLEERQRLARDIHDGLAQVLGYISTKTVAIRLLLQRRRTAAAAEQLSELERAALEASAEVRAAILDLKTPATAHTELIPALEQYVAQFSERSGIPTELHAGLNARQLDLQPASKVQLLRIVQEALTNVHKHANADRAWVTLQPDGNGSLQLTIGDDGRGFDPHAIAYDQQQRFGLETMRERAAIAGGTLAVDSTPGGGTRVVVRWQHDGQSP